MIEALTPPRHDFSASGELASQCDISVVVPVLNEEQCLPELHARLAAVLKSLVATYEIIYVDDGSTDGSLDLMRRFSDENPNVRFISLTRNFGQAAAFAAGQQASCGRAVVTIDSDLQNPPEEIPKLLKKLGEGYEVVYGIRVNRQDSWLRRSCSAVVAKLLRASMGTGVEPGLTAFMATHRRIVDELNRCPEKARFHPALCAYLTSRVAHVEVQHCPRQHGTSRYTYGRLIRLAFDVFTGYTLAPLRAVTVAGILSTVIGLAMGAWAGVLALTGGAAGIPAALVAICLVGGLQLVGIGVLGGYLGRAYIQSLDRPVYVIRQTGGGVTSIKTSRAARAKVLRTPARRGVAMSQSI